MRLFSEEVKVTSSNSPLNILQVKDFQEVFFGVFEVQINEKKYVAEKISEENGNPIVSILVEEGNEKAQYPFLLLKGKQEIYFNSESEPVEIFESNIENEEDEDLEVEELIKETFDNSEIVEDKKQEILEEIKRVKRNAVKKSLEILEHNKAKNIQDIKNESRKKEKALKGYLESARENLVDEFTIISGKIKNELISDNDYKFDEIRESIDLKIQDIADNLNESLGKNFENSSKLIDKSVKKLVKELYESNINPKVDKELKDIAEEIVEKVSEIDKNLNNKLDKKADVSLIEGVNKEIDAIRDANIELNNSLNKGVQKALSRVGNIDKKILEISEKFDNKISETEQEITQYFDEKLSLVKEETLDITDEARKYFQNLIQESRNGLLSEIRKIKNEKPVEYILESKTGKPIVKDWDSIEKDWNKKIHDKFENYKTDLRKYVAVYASGGGTNATQYQDGGTMNGDLTIVGNLSAGDIYSNGNRVATVVTPTRTTLSGNGVLSSFAISGAESLTNPSALIVATDGALQEPGVDYSVGGGYITFTSPLASGAKAVVVSPTNTVQVLDMIPSDGSVTSAKIVGGITLSDPIINNSLALNATSYTYGAGAAEAHKTALGLNSAASLTNTDLERSINANSLNFMPPVTFFDDMDGKYAFTASNIGAGGSGPADFDNFGSRTHGVYGIRTLATISAGRIMFARIPSSAGYVAGARFRACFAISDVANCNFFAGFSWVGTGVSGLVYRSAFNSGQFVFARAMNTDYTGGTFYTFTTQVPQAGAFTSGKRYIVDFTMETLTSCRIKLYIADFNLSNWTEIANSVVTLPSTLVNPAPTFSVQTTAAAIKTLWVDWVSVEQPSFIR